MERINLIWKKWKLLRDRNLRRRILSIRDRFSKFSLIKYACKTEWEIHPINLSQEECSSDISFARSRLIEKSILQLTLRFPNFEKRKKGGGFVSWRGKEGITMVPRTNSSYLLQRIESAETYKCVREAEMKGKEKLSVPFGSQLIGLISKAYLYELCLKHKDILRHGTLSVTRTLDRYQLQIPLKYYTYILLRKRN